MGSGAYGLGLKGDAPRSALLIATPQDTPDVTIARQVGSREVANHVNDEQATVPLLRGGALELTRVPRTAALTTPHRLTDDELAHPYLAPIAAVHSHWLGRAAFHAGGIVVAGRAWGVIGEREAGKSTLLAAVAVLGGTVLADDLLVIDDGEAFAGPRPLDLRREAADYLGGDTSIGCGRRLREVAAPSREGPLLCAARRMGPAVVVFPFGDPPPPRGGSGPLHRPGPSRHRVGYQPYRLPRGSSTTCLGVQQKPQHGRPARWSRGSAGSHRGVDRVDVARVFEGDPSGAECCDRRRADSDCFCQQPAAV